MIYSSSCALKFEDHLVLAFMANDTSSFSTVKYRVHHQNFTGLDAIQTATAR